MEHTVKRFFETLRIEDRIPHHLLWHNARMNHTRRAIYGADDRLDLAQHLSPPDDEGIYRCRVTYGRTIETVEYFPYTPRAIHAIRLIHSDIHYPYKSTNRQAIDALYAQREETDEILIVSPDGYLRDTSIANIALKLHDRWLTPTHPLLPGTTRARLLESGKIETADLRIEDLDRMEGFAVMNAMVGFAVIDLSRFHFS